MKKECPDCEVCKYHKQRRKQRSKVTSIIIVIVLIILYVYMVTFDNIEIIMFNLGYVFCFLTFFIAVLIHELIYGKDKKKVKVAQNKPIVQDKHKIQRRDNK